MTTSPIVHRGLTEAMGAKSGLFVPLVARERVLGVLAAVTTPAAFSAVLVGTETIGPFQAIGNALPWLHDESAIAHIGSGLLFFALAVVTVRAAKKRLT